MEFDILNGCTINKIEGLKKGSEEVHFYTSVGNFKMYHAQECSEEVLVEDVIGDIGDIIGRPVSVSEASSASHHPDIERGQAWTFYHICSTKGVVTIRWYGSSNGYYSEEVSFGELK